METIIGRRTSSCGCQDTHFTSWECSIKTPIHSKSESGWTGHSLKIEHRREKLMNSPSQTQTVLSRLQLANKVPELEYATLLHSVSWPSKRLAHSHSPVSVLPSSSGSCSHIPMLASKDAVASVLPEGDHATARTVLVCPVGIVVICENFVPSCEYE